jgi:hypothetical protein
MFAYARPMTNGADAGATKGFAGSRTAQITMLAELSLFIGASGVHPHLPNETVYEELDEEHISQVGLCRRWEAAKDAPRPS